MKMALAFMKCTSIPGKASGHCCAHGCGPSAASRTHRPTAAQRRAWAEKLPLYLGFFEFVHNARRRGKALLGARLAILVAP